MKNQGLEDVTITNNGATVDNNGKIGKCYSFDGNSSQIRFNSDWIPAMQGHDFTIAFWAYNNDDGDRSVMFATTPTSGWGISIEKTTGNTLRVYWQGNPDIIISDFTLPVGEWIHIAETYTNNSLYVYKNGEKVYERLNTVLASNLTNTWSYASIGRDVRTGSTAFKGKLNDFRWYDHALSPREVKEISKGLVCHYTLSGVGGENLLRNTSFKDGSNNWSLNGGVSLAYNDEYNGQPSVTLIPPASATNRVNIGQICTSYFSNINNLPQVTVSFWYKAESGANNNGVGAMLRIANTNSLYNDIISPTGLKVDGEWHRYEKTVDLSIYNNTGVTAISFMVFCYSKSVSYSMIKLEKGSVATPWTPNSTDDEYTKMGLDDGIEYDVSGYGHNGTKTGAITYDVDTPRYWTSSKFDTGMDICGDNPLSSPCTQFTVAGWVNLTTGYATNQGFHIFGFDGVYCRICISKDNAAVRVLLRDGTTNYTGSSAMAASALTAEKWNHYAITFDNGTLKIYINGLLDSTTTASITSVTFPSTYIRIGRYNIEQPKGKASDIRFYATALSAEDILALYNNPVSLSSNGALLTQGEVTE